MRSTNRRKKQVSDLVRESLRKYIAVQRFWKLRNTVLRFAEAKGILEHRQERMMVVFSSSRLVFFLTLFSRYVINRFSKRYGQKWCG
jgi:heme/copper-type cytochrome/quinol oxidase subunit 3